MQKETMQKHTHPRTLTEDENEDEDSYKEEPSTDTIRKVKEEKNYYPSKAHMSQEEDLESEDSRQDKIFFEMYQTYLRA